MISNKRNSVNLQEELERRILYGLACEWKTAILLLPPSMRGAMKIPFFGLRDLKNRWGEWSGKGHEISLSRELVLKHSWDSVREVLMHETAHQYADMILSGKNEPPHGPCFLKACHLLRANPKASGDYPPLDERVSDNHCSNEDRVLTKIKKLLALAESKNQYEAQAAMAKAHKLIERYNLELLAQHENRNFVSLFLGKPALRRSHADYMLAHIIQDFYFVQGIWVSAYVLEKEKMGRVLEISGTIRNVQMASYVYDFVCHFIYSQWMNYNREKRLSHFRKRDFAVGILEGFRSKLADKEMGQKRQGKRNALIKTEDPMLVNYLHYRYPRIVRFCRGIYTRDEKVLNDGKNIGKRLVISKGIMENGPQKGLLIGD